MPIVSSAVAGREVSMLANAALLLGAVFWIIAYVLIIRRGFQDQIYGVPWPNICLNLSWELYFGLICPARQGHLCVTRGVSLWLTRAWLVLDCVIFLQLLYYGRSWQPDPYMKKYFYPVLAVSLCMAFVGQVTYVHFYHDFFGTQIAWLINLVMSLLFIGMYTSRPLRHGLSYLAAWAKMLGSALTAVGLLLSGSGFANRSYGSFLFGSTFAVDVFYIFLLRRSIRDA